MFGKIQLAQFEGLANQPQKIASAASALESYSHEAVGASFKPILFCGVQEVKGMNYFFIAERTIPYSTPIRNLVLCAVNEFGGEYELVKESIKEIL